MSSGYTIPGVADFPQVASVDTASGPWAVDKLPEPQTGRKAPRGGLRPFGIGVLVALSSLTSGPDPWVIERGRQTSSTGYVLIETAGRRRISLREARQLALQLMVERETARLLAAEDEARRAFNLEDIS